MRLDKDTAQRIRQRLVEEKAKWDPLGDEQDGLDLAIAIIDRLLEESE